MDCEHAAFDEESARNLCQECRGKAARSLNTADILEVVRELRSMRLTAMQSLREKLPRLIASVELLNVERKKPELNEDEKEAAKTTYEVFLFAVNAVDTFELDEVLKERAVRG